MTDSEGCVREWSLVISICSVSDGGGCKPAAVLASKVLPEPGGPCRRRL